MQFKEVFFEYVGEASNRAFQAVELGKQAYNVFDKQDLIRRTVEISTQILSHPYVVAVFIGKNVKRMCEDIPSTMRHLRNIVMMKNAKGDIFTVEERKWMFLNTLQKVMRYGGSLLCILGGMGQSFTIAGSPWYMTACAVQLVGLAMLLIEFRLEDTLRRLDAQLVARGSKLLAAQRAEQRAEQRAYQSYDTDSMMPDDESDSIPMTTNGTPEEASDIPMTTNGTPEDRSDDMLLSLSSSSSSSRPTLKRQGASKNLRAEEGIPPVSLLDKIGFASNGSYFIAGAIHILSIATLLPASPALGCARVGFKAIGTVLSLVGPAKMIGDYTVHLIAGVHIIKGFASGNLY